ncbi:MAG TPA: SDR family NAD(P)-dependent oxidoreductase [Vicinamibacterales bacterium]|nr:SDR family NAD(P)-dependent oxidoreductase [Vicinamibacterales bacterium]
MNEFLERISKLPPKRLALLALELRTRLDQAEQTRHDPIAIVGLGCRVPGGAGDPRAFWEMLRDGVDAVREIPADRWDVEGCYDADPDAPGKMYVREGGFLDGLDLFDPHFFGIAPREVPTLDPQQRLLMEVTWEALEHAGQPIDHLFGSQTGVFVGISSNDYLHLQTRGGNLAQLETYVGTGNASSVAAGRLSYLLGLHGPAVSVDTACSSSLVALHLACQSLSSGECRMAIAAGVNVILGPEANVVLSRAHMLAPDGRCKTFDASADGFGRSEGCGVVILKRLSEAQADGDRVLAVIRGSAVNQDGRSSGITAPNGVAQEALIRQALAKARVEPAHVGYVEAHGTGTTLGDPIEILALANVLREGRPADRPVLVGSVKTNVGHLEAAAGITGLIKVVLSMVEGEIPPHIHFKTPNPHIPWAELPIVIPTKATPWPEIEGRRIAGLSSFGFSGTNAHIVIEGASASAPSGRAGDAAAPDSDAAERPRHILTLSARTEAALDALAARYATFLETTKEPLADVCYTANAGRAHFAHRLAVAGADAPDVRRKLLADSETIRGKVSGVVAPPVAFLFTGQGSQYAGMGRELYDTQPAFRAALDRCDALLRTELDVPLLSVLYPADGASSPIDETRYTQPALFALEYALAEMWQSWGVLPSLVIGHSVGEYVAACIAGVMTLEDALKLIAARGRLMQALPAGGAMAAVWAGEAAVRDAIAPVAARVSIAAVNGPASVVVAGPQADVAALCESWKAAGIRTQALTVSHAFHSPLMDPMLDEFERIAASITYSRPRIGVISNVTGRRAAPDELSQPSYWRRHVRGTVQFAAGMQALAAEGARVFLEIGPAATLLGLGQGCVPVDEAAWLPSLRKDRGAWDTLLASLGALYVRGVDVQWKAFESGYARRKVALPTYPFQREHYWLDKAALAAASSAGTSADVHPLIGRRIASPIKEIIFEGRIDPATLPFLADHRVFGSAVFPATGALEMAIAAAEEAFGAGTTAVEHLSIAEPLVLAEGERHIAQVVLTPDGAASGTFQFFSRPDGHGKGEAPWRLHATAAIKPQPAAAPAGEALDAVRARCSQAQPVDAYYELLRGTGMDYGRSFQGITQLWRGRGEALAEIRLPDGVAEGGFHLHPALADACFQILGAALPAEAAADPDAVYLLVDIDRLARHGAAQPAWSHVRVRDTGSSETLVADFRLFDAAGAVLADVSGLRLKRASRDALRAAARAGAGDWFYRVAWKPAVRPASNASPASTSWLVLGEPAMTNAVAARLTARGDAVRQAAALDDADVTGSANILDLRALSRRDGEDAASTHEEIRRTCSGLLALVQAVARSSASGKPRLWIATRGAQVVESGAPSLAQASIWGFARTLRLEHPELQSVTIDLDPAAADVSADLAAEIASAGSEDQIAIRGSRRYVARLQRAARATTDAGRPGAVELTIPVRGILDNLELKPLARRAPGPGEVEIEVAAAGLNFRDVLNALGMYPGDAGALGNECVGRVSAVGAGVTSVTVGQDVIAMGGGTLSSYATTIADYVAPRPSRLTAEEAATIPVTYLTAGYALDQLAGMKRGDRVLIHAAAGGVGLAAVQLAQRAGAEIFATAGSDEKRQYLASLGIRHIMSSRTLDFASEILARTNGEGIDIVLNSLAGDFIPESLRTLRAGGRFLEIGKTGIWTAEQMRAARPDVAYHAIYLGDVDTAIVQSMMRDLVAAFDRGELKPLPYRVFPLTEAADAFRFMAQARHIGKVVLVPPAAATASAPAVRADASYLITGGLGALGLHIARGLVEAGARHLVLMGRREPGDPALAAIRSLEAAGARVAVVRGDISRRQDVAAALGRANAMAPLRGVVHSAGVLADAVVAEQSAEKFDAVFAPKVLGALHLHELTADTPLDFFALFSSTAAVLGSPGQVNYSAANAALDALALRRAAEGLPAISINWGPWADGGMIASLREQDRSRVSRSGLLSLSPEQGVSAFLHVLSRTDPQITVLPADWKRVGDAAGDDVPPMLADLVRRPASRAAAPQAASGGFVAELDRMPAGRRRSAVQAHVREQVVQVLGIGSSTAVDVTQGLRDLGMDSLMAVELRNRLQRSIGRALPSTLAFDCPTVEALTSYLVKDVLNLSQASAAVQEPAAPAPASFDEPIAIVGMGLRLPGDADTPEKYWDLLRGGVDAISEVPRDRWDIDAYYDPDPAQPGKMYTRDGGFVRDVDRFDPAFFGISPREAVSLDPQQRLLLEVAWEALERAGQAPEKLVGTRSGVFVGISTQDYGQMFAKINDPSRLDAYVGTGNSLSVAAGRLSYVLGLQGPSMAIDTACSSSLVAIHLACSSLRNRECELALAGGVNLILTPELTINFCRARMLAPNGRCKTFDAAADGYVRGEGAGMIVLKRLSDAVAANDRILAVIRGSAVNQDGRSSGLTVPNGPAQQALLREALAAARVSPEDVGYIEAHGTGTSLGDPIELQAVAEVFGAAHSPERPLVVGSVKTNFGHLEAAAGIAGVAKVVLALQHGEIPPHLHFTEMNPHIETGGAPIVIPTAPMPWPAAKDAGTQRVAGVSSFGFGGTNAHIVLSAFAPASVEGYGETAALHSDAAGPERSLHIAVLSAKNDAALGATAAAVAAALENDASLSAADAAFTLNTGRSPFSHRAAVLAKDRTDLAAAFGTIAEGKTSPNVARGIVDGDEQPAVAFLFTGQGSQYPGMARTLYETQPVFRAELDRCDALLAPELGRSILSIVHPAVDDGALVETRFTQPALFAVEYALAQLWRSWGIEPAAVMGHSLGEYVAACVAGVVSLEDGLRIAATRGRLMQALSAPGAMAAVFADEAAVRTAIAPHAASVSIAALNGPGNTVISGAAEAVAAIVAQLEKEGVRATRLEVSHAFHSPLMEPMLDEFERVLSGMTWHPARIPVVSNVTGSVAADAELADPAYWRKHAREAVRFGDGILALHEQGCRVFLEVGPSPTLLAMGRRAAGDREALWVPSLRKGRDDWEQMLETAAALYVNGVAIDWAGFDAPYRREKVVLPTYAFQRQRYWIETGPAAPVPAAAPQVFVDVDAAARRQSFEGPLDLALHTYDGKWRALEELTTAYIVNAFVALGAFTRAGDRQDQDTLIERFAVTPTYRKLLGRWLSRLALEGLLRADGAAFVADAPLPRRDVDALWAAAADLADVPFLKEYIQRSGGALAAVITGKASSVETLFPDGRLDIAEGLYERSAPSRYINGLARSAVAAFVNARRGRTINLLELGAGTGGTTSSMLPALPAGGAQYWFTDVSDFFLKRAEGKFAAFDFVRYGLLNIEEEPQGQGYPAHFFDVVLAANVLHATSDLRRTIAHARSLIAPGGILVLCEDTSYHSFFDITIALMDGWQRFGDDLRGDHPLVAAETWKQALADGGFDLAVAYPEQDCPAAIMGQSVIIARAPLSGAAADGASLDEFTRAIEARRGGSTGADAARDAEALRLRLAEALPTEQEEILVEFVRGHVAGVLRLDPSAIPERRQRLMDLGLDSLMAVELRNRLATGVGGGIAIPATLMFDYPTIEAIARYLRRQVLGPETPAPEAAAAADAALAAAKIAELSDEEAEALLIQKLESL